MLNADAAIIITQQLEETIDGGGGGGGGGDPPIDIGAAEAQQQQQHHDAAAATLNNKTLEVVEVPIIPKGYSLIRFPKEKSLFRKIMWFVLWPIHFLFMLTIPDCERPSLKKLFPLTFIMCIVWIGSLSYMVAWMITIIGKVP